MAQPPCFGLLIPVKSGHHKIPPSISSSPSFLPSYHPFFPVMLSEQRSEAGMSKAHVRRRKGFCGGRRDEAVRGNAVSADTQVSRASLCLPLFCACPLLPCLITLHVRYYCYCQGLDVVALLARIEPSFDTVPRRLCCVVVMCCWRLMCGGKWAEIKGGGEKKGGHVVPFVIENNWKSMSCMSVCMQDCMPVFACPSVHASQHACAHSCHLLGG